MFVVNIVQNSQSKQRSVGLRLWVADQKKTVSKQGYADVRSSDNKEASWLPPSFYSVKCAWRLQDSASSLEKVTLRVLLVK
jgi:hypothetical protein